MRPAIERSSSRSSQCSPTPPPPISHWARCSGVASRRTGNQLSGTLKIRPSVSVTCIETSSNSTDRAKALVGTKDRRRLAGFVEVLMPSLQEFGVIETNELFNLRQLTAIESPILG